MEEETVVTTTEVESNDASNIINFPTKNKKKPPKRIPASAISPNTPSPIEPESYEGDEGVTNEEHDEEKRRALADTICSGIMAEAYFKLMNMGYEVHSEQFEKDLEFAQEALHSAILRTYDIFHPVQEFVDENFELVAVEDFDPSIFPVPPTANT